MSGGRGPLPTPPGPPHQHGSEEPQSGMPSWTPPAGLGSQRGAKRGEATEVIVKEITADQAGGAAQDGGWVKPSVAGAPRSSPGLRRGRHHSPAKVGPVSPQTNRRRGSPVRLKGRGESPGAPPSRAGADLPAYGGQSSPLGRAMRTTRGGRGGVVLRKSPVVVDRPGDSEAEEHSVKLQVEEGKAANGLVERRCTGFYTGKRLGKISQQKEKTTGSGSAPEAGGKKLANLMDQESDLLPLSQSPESSPSLSPSLSPEASPESSQSQALELPGSPSNGLSTSPPLSSSKLHLVSSLKSEEVREHSAALLATDPSRADASPVAARQLRFNPNAKGPIRAKHSKHKQRHHMGAWLERTSIYSVEEVPFELCEQNVDNLFKILLKKGSLAQKKISSAKLLCSLAYPDEMFPNIRQRIFDSGLVPQLMQMAQEGTLRVYRPIEKCELEIGDLIAKGAGGLVKAAKYQGRDVAVKLCGEAHTWYTSAEEFRFEVAAMVLLHHKNILPCIGANEEDETPFMVTPLKERGPITSLLSFDKPAKKLPLSMKMQLAMQVANAMSHLHRCNVLHRDLKPSNILIGKDMSVCLIDFGVSRVRDAKRPMTMNVGTTAYIAPEVFVGDGSYTTALDVYSFAIVLWEIVYERRPFSEISNFEIPDAVVRGQRPPMEDSSMPQLAHLIRQCWAQNPRLRPKFPQVVKMLQDVMDAAIWNTQKKKTEQALSGQGPNPKRAAMNKSAGQSRGAFGKLQPASQK